MKGKWVNAVVIRFSKRGQGVNSVYEDYGMAARKRDRLKKVAKIADESGNKGANDIFVQKIMYFKDKVNEGSFEDYCSICGHGLFHNEILPKKACMIRLDEYEYKALQALLDSTKGTLCEHRKGIESMKARMLSNSLKVLKYPGF